jgi:hypothetical protein
LTCIKTNARRFRQHRLSEPTMLAHLQRRVAVLTGAGLLALSGGLRAADGLGDALRDGKPWAELRYRYEHVAQASVARHANASTLRARVGYETGRLAGFAVLLEAEAVTALGAERYNSTVNGKTAFPTVADPGDTEINRAALLYAGLPKTSLAYGRQRIAYDNQRFVGNVGWRQNEQTYDAFTVVNESLPDTRISAGYIYNVNRVFGERSPVGNVKMASPVLNVSYRGLAVGELVGYVYALDFKVTPAASTQTWGLRLRGSRPFGDARATYTAEYAVQRDYRGNPADFRLKYYRLEAGAALQALDFNVGYEVLGSNGTVAVQTPLATLHAMNGWADVFLVTPAAGLRDFFPSVATTLAGIRLEAIRHDFRADRGGFRHGTEWDLQAVKAIDKVWSVGAKYAAYRARRTAVDTDKFWLWVEAKF